VNSDPLARARILLYEQDRPELAERELKRRSALLADNAEANAMLGYCALEQNQLQDARRHLESALAINPEFALPYYWLAALEVQQERFPIAEQLVREAIRLEHDKANYRALLARILLRRCMKEEALIEAEAALSLDACNVICLQAKAEVLIGLARRTEAIEVLDRALQIQPNNAHTHGLLHVAKCVNPDTSHDAQMHLQLALRNAPNDPFIQKCYRDDRIFRFAILPLLFLAGVALVILLSFVKPAYAAILAFSLSYMLIDAIVKRIKRKFAKDEAQ
jgi:tetratricopeptide (TPR) repeat protein